MNFDPLQRLRTLQEKKQVNHKSIAALLTTTNNQITALKKEARSAHTFNTPKLKIPAQIVELGSARLTLKKLLQKLPKTMLYFATAITVIGALNVMLERIKNLSSNQNPMA